MTFRSALVGMAAGLLLWIVAFATGQATFFIVGTLLIVLCSLIAGHWKVRKNAAEQDLDAGVYVRSVGWFVVTAEWGGGEDPDICTIEVGSQKLKVDVDPTELQSIARVLREQPISGGVQLSDTSARVWAEVIWLPHLERVLELCDGGNNLIYRESKYAVYL
jgi:hypothetical protein